MDDIGYLRSLGFCDEELACADFSCTSGVLKLVSELIHRQTRFLLKRIEALESDIVRRDRDVISCDISVPLVLPLGHSEKPRIQEKKQSLTRSTRAKKAKQSDKKDLESEREKARENLFKEIDSLLIGFCATQKNREKVRYRIADLFRRGYKVYVANNTIYYFTRTYWAAVPHDESGEALRHRDYKSENGDLTVEQLQSIFETS